MVMAAISNDFFRNSTGSSLYKSTAVSSSRISSQERRRVTTDCTLSFLELIRLTLKSSSSQSTFTLSPARIPSIKTDSSKGIIPSIFATSLRKGAAPSSVR